MPGAAIPRHSTAAAIARLAASRRAEVAPTRLILR
jgi:hypothetical protein